MNRNDRNWRRKFARAIPKAELHVHLEGAIPAPALLRLIRRDRTQGAGWTRQRLEDKLRYSNFEAFIETWVWKNRFINRAEDFRTITRESLGRIHRENVHYVELTFSPADFFRHGLTTAEITEAVIEGRNEAMAETGIRCQLIADLVRDYGVDSALERIEELTPYLSEGLVGVTIGGSEQAFPPAPFAPAFRLAKRRGFRLSAHAGEAAGSQSVRDALDALEVDRIGHGLRAFEDPAVVEQLRQRRIPLEMCIISNLRTGACPSIDQHPIARYHRQGLLVTVSSDDPVMFNCSISDEYLTLISRFDFHWDDLKQVSLNGIDAAFLEETDKASLRAQFEREWVKLASIYRNRMNKDEG